MSGVYRGPHRVVYPRVLRPRSCGPWASRPAGAAGTEAGTGTMDATDATEEPSPRAKEGE